MYHAEDWGSYDWYEGQWNTKTDEPEGVGVYVRVGFNFIHYWKDIGIFTDEFKLVEGWKYEQASKTYINTK